MYPTNAESTIAIVPQMVILNMAFLILEPPVFAAVVPKNIRKIVVKPYNQYSIPFTGAKSITKRGKMPPTENAAPDAMAA